MKGKEKEGTAYATCCKQQQTGPKAYQLEKWQIKEEIWYSANKSGIFFALYFVQSNWLRK